MKKWTKGEKKSALILFGAAAAYASVTWISLNLIGNTACRAINKIMTAEKEARDYAEEN